ncbi:MAG: class IIb bacteriocin, lactobin A/cerein 7B family [Bacilli bacterium]|nr:class IIb bacteriocin, lactobin A/cerein 7B family [Bacilli bacterium]
MKKLNEIELKKIDGGGITFGFGLALGALITLLSGIIDGYIRPLSCR